MKQTGRNLLYFAILFVAIALTSCQIKQSISEDRLRGVYVTDLSALKSFIEESEEYRKMGKYREFASAFMSMTLSNVELLFQFKENGVFVLDVEGDANLISAMLAASIGDELPLVAEYRMENDSLLCLRSLEELDTEFKPYAVVRKLGDYEYLRLKIITDEDDQFQNLSFTLKRVEAEPNQ